MDVDNEIAIFRDEFPILKYKTYLNSAAHGPGLQRVRDAVEDYWGFRMREDVDVNFPDAKAEASKLIHASIDEICWCNRVTQGLNMVANMMEFETGENIVVTDLAYPSNVFVWLPFREQGVEIRRIRHRDGMINIEDFEKAIDNKTRIVSISHIEWTCGILYDIKAISEMAHDNGALLVDDAYQAIGALEVNVKTDNIDFLVVGGEKWLCCPTLIGIFYICKDLIDQFEPTYRFYNQVEEAFRKEPPWVYPNHDNISDYDKALLPTAEKFYRGCVSESAVWGFHAALHFFNQVGMKRIQRRVRRLSGYLIDGLRELGLHVNTPLEPSERGGLVAYTTGKHRLNVKSHRTFTNNNIITALRYQEGVGGIRVSTHFFNTEEEIDRLLRTQKELL